MTRPFCPPDRVARDMAQRPPALTDPLTRDDRPRHHPGPRSGNRGAAARGPARMQGLTVGSPGRAEARDEMVARWIAACRDAT